MLPKDISAHRKSGKNLKIAENPDVTKYLRHS